jgi:hypothetical protein
VCGVAIFGGNVGMPSKDPAFEGPNLVRYAAINDYHNRNIANNLLYGDLGVLAAARD